MVIPFVGAGDGVDDQRNIVVGNNGAFDSHRAGESHGGRRDGQDRGRVGHLQSRRCQGPSNLPFIRFVVTSEQDCHRFAIGDEDQGLNHLFRFAFQQFTNRFNAADIRSMQPGNRFRVRRRGNHRRLTSGFCPFQIGGIVRFLAEHDSVFAVGRRDHEFMRCVSADRTAFRFHRQKIESAPREDAAVGTVHLLINFVQ